MSDKHDEDHDKYLDVLAKDVISKGFNFLTDKLLLTFIPEAMSWDDKRAVIDRARFLASEPDETEMRMATQFMFDDWDKPDGWELTVHNHESG